MPVVIVGAAHEAAWWRTLASHLHSEGRQNAKDASFYWKPYTQPTGSRASCPLLLRFPRPFQILCGFSKIEERQDTVGGD